MKINLYLEQTLFDMLKKRPIDKIRSIDIVKTTDTCKGTFYKYYKDKYDLLINCMKHYIYKDVNDSDTWDKFITGILAAFESNPEVIINAFSSNDVWSVKHYNEQIIGDYIIKQREAHGKPVKDYISRKAIIIYETDITDVMLDWLKGGCKESKYDILGLINAIQPKALDE